MQKNLSFFYNRLTEQLWFKPLIFCLLSIGAALAARFADGTSLENAVPSIEKDSLEELLKTISASMLVIAIFAVGAMLSAFAAASGSATPRSFKLVVADDVSQNALSVYIGAFIFSIIATVAFKNGYYGEAGRFVLFVITLLVFALVIFTFLRWVERISKLGRLGHTIQKVEAATKKSLEQLQKDPWMGARPVSNRADRGLPVFSAKVGYIQHIRVDQLHALAEDAKAVIELNGLPGTFLSPDRPLAFIHSETNTPVTISVEKIRNAVTIGDERVFDEDPRFGFIALSEIASRALSPGINDPGTAVAIIGSFIRLFSAWLRKEETSQATTGDFDRVEIPDVSIADLFEDAFRPISRDGAGNIEVMLRLQKAFRAIAYVGDKTVKEQAELHSRAAYERAEEAMDYKPDLAVLRKEVLFT